MMTLGGASICPGCGNTTKPDEVIMNGVDLTRASYRCGECGRAWEINPDSNISDEEVKKIIVSNLYEIEQAVSSMANNTLEIKRTLTRIEKLLKKVIK